MDEWMVREIRTLLSELADDLKSELDSRYEGLQQYAYNERRYNRDMEIVTKAREMIQRIERYEQEKGW